MIELKDVHKQLGGRMILDGLSLTVEEGETLVILGRSGTGKSVTLRHVIGLLTPDHGEIEVLGEEISHHKPEILRKVRRRIGYLFQDGALLNWLNLADNIGLPLRERRAHSEEEIQQRIAEVLSEVELDGHATKLPSEISGGMRKRAGLARALVCQPEIMLYDEPTSGLDPISSTVINGLIMKLKEMGITQMVVTHDMKSAFEVADRIALLHGGKVHALGTAEEFRGSSDPAVQQFIHGNVEGPLAREFREDPGADSLNNEESEES
ncbi:MAG: ABC transporter ATP-binding protein [Planctomycetota bacterium]|nr:MAG: ABC transporter ATP-binding protein [Planctomycetota bacterium]